MAVMGFKSNKDLCVKMESFQKYFYIFDIEVFTVPQ